MRFAAYEDFIDECKGPAAWLRLKRFGYPISKL